MPATASALTPPLNPSRDDQSELASLVASRALGCSLPGAFYTSDNIFHADLNRIWRKEWLFAAHNCELPGAGNCLVVAVAGDSILLARDEAGILHAMHNVCRHRGSLICDAHQTRAARFVCPYHQWTYGLDGRLLASPGFTLADGQSMALRHIDVAEAGGFIFIRLDADGAPDFPPAKEWTHHLHAYQLNRTKPAAVVNYTVNANWKVILENNRECLHCRSNHPEYCRATFDVSRDAGTQHNDMAMQLRRLEPILARNGIDVARLGVSSAMTWPTYRLNHTPLVAGFMTESLDGQPVAPPLGTLDTADVGTVRITAFPNFWCHVSGDHAVTTRLLPLAPDRTAVRVTWLVRDDAVENRDYDRGHLLPFWKNTSEQDWTICERVQAGVATNGYVPGPLSPTREMHVEQLINWYLSALAPTST